MWSMSVAVWMYVHSTFYCIALPQNYENNRQCFKDLTPSKFDFGEKGFHKIGNGVSSHAKFIPPLNILLQKRKN